MDNDEGPPTGSMYATFKLTSDRKSKDTKLSHELKKRMKDVKKLGSLLGNEKDTERLNKLATGGALSLLD